MDPTEYNAWASRFLWRSHMPETCPARDFDPDSQRLADWVRDVQRESGLAVDGCLGPATLFVCMARWSEGPGSVGAAIIGGEEVDVGTPVVRFFEPEPIDAGDTPRLGILLNARRLLFDVAQRVAGKQSPRSHFTIGSSRGPEGRSLLLQWADPCADVAFTPPPPDEAQPTGVPGRRAVGVELENPLSLHELRHEQRPRGRIRDVISGEVCGRRGRQLGYFPEQIATLERLLGALETRLGIPRAFPKTAGASGGERYVTDVRPLDDWQSFEGWLGRFNLYDDLGEPGVGLVEVLEPLFGELERAQPGQAIETRERGERRSSSGGRTSLRGAPPPPARRAATPTGTSDSTPGGSGRPPLWMVERGWVAENPDGDWEVTASAPDELRSRLRAAIASARKQAAASSEGVREESTQPSSPPPAPSSTQDTDTAVARADRKGIGGDAVRPFDGGPDDVDFAAADAATGDAVAVEREETAPASADSSPTRRSAEPIRAPLEPIADEAPVFSMQRALSKTGRKRRTGRTRARQWQRRLARRAERERDEAPEGDE